MATSTYLTGRKRYSRPQGLLFSDNPGTLQNGLYVPSGYEVGADTTGVTDPNLIDQFIILSDHNRSEIDFPINRIEDRRRMIDGRMRSYHVADKKSISVSWSLLPSRSHKGNPNFNSSGEGSYTNINEEFTADNGAGGVDLLDWYENHPGSFWVFLAYDKYTNFVENSAPPVDDRYLHMGQYNEIIEVYFADFNYTVVKRGGLYDFWNISLTLEEV